MSACLDNSRFIPACAGNIGRRSASHPRHPVHPRVCGEHCKSAQQVSSHAGSSPRVRGTLKHSGIFPSETRFIPACAGNILWPWRSKSRITVHPRVCGEHEGEQQRVFSDAGSSPRVRGTSVLRPSVASLIRFIPACAGNIGAGGQRPAAAAVHPRVCGEHQDVVDLVVNPVGSSPRVRGTYQVAVEHIGGQRFIPACAGNMAVRSINMSRSSVHPRVCGEHAGAPRALVGGSGSSPRVRGTSNSLY